MTTPSQEKSAESLLARLASDEALCEKIEAVGADSDAITRLLEGEGYQISREEWQQALAKWSEADILGDKDLAGISGGGIFDETIDTRPTHTVPLPKFKDIWNRITGLF